LQTIVEEHCTPLALNCALLPPPSILPGAAVIPISWLPDAEFL
jgi:hypothetical protein